MSNIHKIWGCRRRIHLDSQHETDLLYLKKDTFCSTHSHNEKSTNLSSLKEKLKSKLNMDIKY